MVRCTLPYPSQVLARLCMPAPYLPEHTNEPIRIMQVWSAIAVAGKQGKTVRKHFQLPEASSYLGTGSVIQSTGNNTLNAVPSPGVLSAQMYPL
jgi:hypothetical protein